MVTTRIHEVVDRLSCVRTEDSTRTEMAAVLADVRALRGFADAVEATALARLAVLASSGHAESPAEVLRDAGHRSSSEARAAASRAGVCAELPEFHSALGAGAISSAHVDAVARATARLDDDARATFAERASELVAAASSMPVDEFAKRCRETARDAVGDDGLSELERQRGQRTVSRHVDQETGMAITRLVLDPQTDERVWNAVTAAMRSRAATLDDDGTSWEHAAVDTVVELVTGARSVSKRTPSIVVHVDWAGLVAEAERQGLCETDDGTSLPTSTVRRLCCEANIIPAVLGGDGEVLDIGRAMRLASPAQRQALAAMYSCCGFPGCTVVVRHTDAHHVTDWTRSNGPTDLANLLPLCDRHHHLVHEGRWRLELRPDRTITVTRPDGVVHFEGSSLNRRRPAA